MPNLRASDFDYIIFDISLEQTSPRWNGGFMDKLLLVVEAGRIIVKFSAWLFGTCRIRKMCRWSEQGRSTRQMVELED